MSEIALPFEGTLERSLGSPGVFVEPDERAVRCH